MNDHESAFEQVAADGGTRPLTPEQLRDLKTEFDRICTDAGESVNDRRELAEDTRFTRWEGQSRTGKKLSDAMGGAVPFPFEGASDARVRTADEIINEQVMILMAALMRAQLGFRGIERGDDELAGHANTLWNWVLRNQVAREWFVEWTKCAQYRQGDSPGVGIMQVSWHEQQELVEQTLTQEQAFAQAVAAATASAGRELGPDEIVDLQDLLVNEARRPELEALLLAFLPELPAGRAARVARALQEEGTATYPHPQVAESRLKVKARRLFQDIFIPENTDHDLQRARCIFVTEWFTRPELEARDALGEFLPGMLEEVLKHEGESAWKHWSHYQVEGDYSEEVLQRTYDRERRRGQYEIVTAFYRATNADGIPGVYTVQFHSSVEQPLTEAELFGKAYPFVPVPREILTDSLWDVRGVAELAMTEQASLKLLHDSFMDHAQLTTVPPLEVPTTRPRMRLVLGPLKEVRVQRTGEIRPINLGTYPIGNDKVQGAIQARIDRYFGRMSATNPPDLVRLYQQWLVDFWLLDVLQVMKMGLRCVLDYMDPAKIQRVLGEEGAAGVDVAALRGDLDLEASFDAGMLNFEFLKGVGEIITTYVLSWDTVSTVRRDELIRWFFGALSPTLARRVLVPVQTAQQTEVDDEQLNFTKIKAGIEPPMMEAGQNFGLRLQVLLGIGQQNPEALQTLPPRSREIYEARIKHLYGMVTQQTNAVIGRQQARPALQQDPMSQLPA